MISHSPATGSSARRDRLRASAEVIGLVVLGAVLGGISILPLGASLNAMLFACCIVSLSQIMFVASAPGRRPEYEVAG